MSGTCPDDEFQCADSTCIPLKFQCDGTKDCLDGTDENDCNEHPICHEDEKLCQIDQKCIPKDYWCDKDPDCTDGSDEKNCPIDDLKCDYPSWRCDNDSKCLEVTELCNGHYDCEDETDEGSRCQFNLCADFNTCSGMFSLPIQFIQGPIHLGFYHALCYNDLQRLIYREKFLRIHYTQSLVWL